MHVLSPHRCGWALPFGARVRLARMLLGTLFAVEDRGEPTEGRAELTSLLRLMWLPLGISERVHAGLFAWVHFTEYMSHPGRHAHHAVSCILYL